MQRVTQEESDVSGYTWLDGLVAGLRKGPIRLQVDRTDLWTLLNSLPAAVLLSTDRACSRIFGNLAAHAMLQVPLGSNVSQSALENELPGFKVYSNGLLVPIQSLPMQQAAATGQPVGRSECEIRFDTGYSIFIAGHCIPIHDEQGEVCGSLGAFIDITEQRQNFERSALIAREMTHRVKNSVSIIQALAHGTIRKRLNPDDYAAFEQRLVNIARAQEMMGSEYRTGADLSEMIARVVEGVVQRDMGRVSWEGPKVDIDADASVSLSMVLHELATNACKYGALKHDEGSVEITWTSSRLGDDRRIHLAWKEGGACLPAQTPKPGFGTRLIENIIKSTRGGSVTSEYLPDGLLMIITFTIQDQSHL